jgi:hypothetical protein
MKNCPEQELQKWKAFLVPDFLDIDPVWDAADFVLIKKLLKDLTGLRSVLVPIVNPSTITPYTESFQALVWHLLVSHPKLKAAAMKSESMQRPIARA